MPRPPHAADLPATRPARIAVLRALQLGDLLCAVPAWRALRTACPHAEITLVGLPWAWAFAERFAHLFDGFLEWPGLAGMPERPAPSSAAVAGFLAAARARGFDWVLQMHGDGTLTNPVALQMGGARTGGFFAPGGRCPDPRTFAPYPDDRGEVARMLALTGFLGVPADGGHLTFPLTQADRDEADALPEWDILSRAPFAVIHPGARSADRRWPAERFAAVGDELSDRGLLVVLTGSADEAALTQRVMSRMQAPCFDLTGRTGVGALAVVLSAARLLVANDTGVSHLAAALGTPSAIVFTGSDPARWAHPDGPLRRSLIRPGDPSAVVAAADLLLSRPAEPAHAAR